MYFKHGDWVYSTLDETLITCTEFLTLTDTQKLARPLNFIFEIVFMHTCTCIIHLRSTNMYQQNSGILSDIHMPKFMSLGHSGHTSVIQQTV